MDAHENDLPGRWRPCEVGNSEGMVMYWLVDYNAPHRGFVLADGRGFVGVVCDQGSNPWSRDGVVAHEKLHAQSLSTAIAEFENFCADEGYCITLRLRA